ncbi:hypothetical protein TrCOL_g9550 [Triparma columacea]|uniref:Uncharacterized protein n=1 Tax=Triparma columacea TaxID=722753 RepID=A0A9W7G7Z9_9STRA|nr:hypothetical protein TrCOL_g9550 [Triparma columacea]
MSRASSMDLDAAMDAIEIDDDLSGFLSPSQDSPQSPQSSTQSPTNEKTNPQSNSQSNISQAVLVGNKENPFDDGDSTEDEDSPSSSSPQPPPPPTTDVSNLISSTISTIQTYHTTSTTPLGYTRNPQEQLEIESFVSELGGWQIDDLTTELGVDVLNQGSDKVGLLSTLRPSSTSQGVGPPIIRRETLEKKGTSSVVKSTNKRDLVLTTECVVVCKVLKRNRDSNAGDDIRGTMSEPGRGKSEDGEEGIIKGTHSEGGGNRGGIQVEVKQYERLCDLMVIDLTKTSMLTHGDDPSASAPTLAEAAVEEEGEKKSRNPFKNFARKKKTGRASMIPKSLAGAFLGMGKKESTKASSEDSKASGNKAQTDIFKVMDKLVSVGHNSSLSKSPELSFALITPLRTYIFTSPNPTSHAVWVTLLSQSIIASHIRNNSKMKRPTTLPTGWRHLVSRTSIYTACLTNDLPMLHSTLTETNVNKRDPSGYTPLHYASMGMNLEIAVYLLDKGADPNALDMSECRTPLFSAISNTEGLPMVRLLISNGGDATVQDVNGVCLSHLAAMKLENSKDAYMVLRLLTSAGCDVNEVDGEGNTPMHLAAEGGKPRMVKVLSNVGARVGVRRVKDGLTPLQVVCAEEGGGEEGELFDVETMRNLIGVGACPNLPVREDGRVRGSVYERDKGMEGEGRRRTALDVLMCGAKGQRVLEGNAGEEVDEVWCYKVFVGIMELVRGGCRYGEELEAMMPEGIKEVCRQGRKDWKDRKIGQDELLKFSHHLFKPIDKSLWKEDSASSACMLCEDGFTAVNRRHHCRMCGILACGACTSKAMVILGPGGELANSSKDSGGVGGFFANISGASGPREERVCDSCFNRTLSHLAELQEETADRGKLMARIDREMNEADERQIEETRGELFAGAEGGGKGGGGGRGGGGAHSAMAEAMDNVNKRGEKLEQINDKSEAMKDAARDFKDMARTLKNQQQKKAARWGF